MSSSLKLNLAFSEQVELVNYHILNTQIFENLIKENYNPTKLKKHEWLSPIIQYLCFMLPRYL